VQKELPVKKAKDVPKKEVTKPKDPFSGPLLSKGKK